ncbi:IclR family transcriptional regulator [Brevibacterium aurantiacum]|uniref:IclR family transcriptional regulator n=1 Tax=Brevibacterium aurantiacum TaxID=273384 RepID=UPI001D05156D|nr:IclR family transcriptional regulator C-terminal domain-containing protein [Brevibacterium aurantiacum]
MASHRLAALRDEVGETVHLVLHDGEGLFVALCMDSPQPVRTHVEIGAWSPLHATSSGIAFLATLPDNAVEDVLDKGLPRYTANTPVTREEVWNEVQRVRDRGFAVNPTGWWRPDVFAVAAAITDPDMAPVAAVTISAPASRFTEAKSADLGRRVRALADELTQGLRMQSGASERSLPSAETRV